MTEHKVYVGNLPFSIGFKELKEIFSECGEILNATVIADKFTGKSKGFGFVTFAHSEAMHKAIKEMNEKEVQGRRIQVKPATPSEKRQNSETELEKE
jgi:cold-inducible RNA-binding protein